MLDQAEIKERIASQGAVGQVEHARGLRQAGPRGDRDAPQGVEGRGC